MTNWLNANTITGGDETSYITKKQLIEHYHKKYPESNVYYKPFREKYVNKINEDPRKDQIYRVDEGDMDAALNNRVYSASGNVKDELLEEIGKINTSGSGSGTGESMSGF